MPRSPRRPLGPLTLLTAGAVLAAGLVPLLPAQEAAAAPRPAFDLQAHRGGLGLTVESTLGGFERALRLGVSTLELDVQITRDGEAVVTHDRVVSAAKCRDTAPAAPGDAQWPYVGDYVKDLSLAQVRTLDCGTLTLAQYPGQRALPGARMPLLSEVFALVDRYRARDVVLNVETKVEAGAPHETAPREQFVQVVAAEVLAAGKQRQVTIQSFDWGALVRMRQVAPGLPLVALDNGQFLQTGMPGASPWLGGIDIDDFGGDPVAAAASLGASAWSPVQGTPQNGTVGDPAFVPYVDRADVVRAHGLGLDVVPWTVNDRATMAHFMAIGVDGLITDRPDVLRDLMAERGYRLPKAYTARDAGVVHALPNAHAHNDYEHDRPLQDALDQGFTSVEADVWLVDGQLLVAHDLEDVDPARTLESLYLQPLADRVRRGTVHQGWDGSLQLLIDIKSDGPTTYAAVSQALSQHKQILTRFAPTYRAGAVEVVISGNRPLEQMRAERTRFAGYDGRLGDLASGLPATVMPLVSDNWANHFTWSGVGPMPAAEQARLQQLVADAHARGYRLRFWNTPDLAGPQRTTLWSVLVDSGVDHVNTDDLTGLAAFLQARYAS